MTAYRARMVHPEGPKPFPDDVLEERDSSQDPRSVFTLGGTEDEARAALERDNPGFEFASFEVVEEGGAVG